jgi:hypothetical protein
MPKRLIPALFLSCGTLTLTYVVLMVTTIFFAAWQTQAMSSVRSSESAIGNLEASYYTSINHLSSLNPTTLGYVSPAQVEYVTKISNTSTGLSFAGN